jgi:hypothetical protein
MIEWSVFRVDHKVLLQHVATERGRALWIYNVLAHCRWLYLTIYALYTW